MAGNHLHSRVITYDHREAKKIRALISTKMIVKILIKLFVEEVKFNFVMRNNNHAFAVRFNDRLLETIRQGDNRFHENLSCR